MNKTIQVTCLNNQKVVSYPYGTNLLTVFNDLAPQLKSPVLAALVDNELKELSYCLYNPKRVQFIDISHPDGMRTYVRSLTFLLQVAVREVLPDHQLSVEHSVSKGIYCEINNGSRLTMDQITAVEIRMRELVRLDLPFEKEKIPTSEAIELFKKEGYHKKALLLETRGKLSSSVYYLNGRPDHFYGPLVYSTASLSFFGLFSYYHGVLLMIPQAQNHNALEGIIVQNKMFQIFQEHKDLFEVSQINTIGSINKAVQKGWALELIQVNEALHEKKYAHIADKIAAKQIKLVLIAGPSSSGKTTSAKRLSMHLKINKLRPVVIELDNYFVNREFTPKDIDGGYDFESLHAVDLPFFNAQIKELLEGKTVNLPQFDFIKGERYFDPQKTIHLKENDILVIEGIHGLNPELIQSIPDEQIFRVYASALTSVNIDENNRIPTTDNRLIRRIVRDAATRGHSATATIARWQSVRRGEDRNIFPFQENADVMFNSSLLYELSVLRRYVEPLLRKVRPDAVEYAEALRLLKFISYFEQIDLVDENNIPPTSVLREFIGGSSFKY